MKIGIALGGGSSKGLAHIGVLEVLQENGIALSGIAGTSIGAIVGAAYAAEPDATKLRQKALALLESDFFSAVGLEFFVEEESAKPGLFRRIGDFVKRRYILGRAAVRPHLVSADRIESLLKASLPDVLIEELRIPFACVALDITTGDDVVFKSGPLIRAVQASISIPGLFPCVELEGRVLVDGGATASVPVDAARQLGVDCVVGVDLLDKLSREFSCSSGLDINFRVDDIAKRRLNLMRAQEADVVIRPRLGTVHWADFGKLDFCIRRGREAALGSLATIKGMSRARKRSRWNPFQYLLDRGRNR